MLKDTANDIGFKNEISRRFYEWCKVLIDSGEITSAKLAAVLGKYESNPSRILSELKTGKIGVTLEWITLCQEKLGLNPASLFMSTESRQKPAEYKRQALEEAPILSTGDDANILLDTGEELSEDVKVDAFVSYNSSQAAKQLHQLLQRHQVPIDKYARQNLSISRQQFYNYVNGNSRLPFDLVQKVCEDMGESLDLFRSKPLPEGHLLQRVAYLTELLKAKEEIINLLKSKA